MSINQEHEHEEHGWSGTFEDDVDQYRKETEPFEESELIGIEQVTIRSYRNGDVFFVRSATQDAKFYRVQDGTCMCKGFEFRGDCNHLRHLLKEGYLIEDTSNGHGYRLASGVAKRRVSREVVTGTKVVPDDEGPVANQLGGQVVRLQDLVRAQDRLVVAQRRLITAMRGQRSDQMMFRAIHAVEQEEQNVRIVEEALKMGDAVELDI